MSPSDGLQFSDQHQQKSLLQMTQVSYTKGRVLATVLVDMSDSFTYI